MNSKAHSLAMWMRDLGSSREQIASVLGIETREVSGVLGRARSIGSHPARLKANGASNVLVFLNDADDRVVDRAAALARRRHAKLHLVARYRRLHHGAFGVSATKMRKGASYREEAEARLLDAARLAVHRGIDVVPHAIAGSEADALRLITEGHGAMIVVVDGRDHRHLEKAAHRVGAEMLVADGKQGRAAARSRVLNPAFS
jgi:hypothetical protein